MIKFETEKKLIAIYRTVQEVIAELRNTKNAFAIIKANIGKRSFGASAEKYFQIFRMEAYIEKVIEELETQICAAELSLKELPSIQAKVCYMRDIELKSLQQIADEMDYSLGYIQNISANVSKM